MHGTSFFSPKSNLGLSYKASGAKTLSASIDGVEYDPKDDPNNDDFRAGGDLWRVLTEDKKEILIQNTAGDIEPVTENIKYRHAVHCYLADKEYGERITKAMGLDMSKVEKLSKLSNDELNRETTPK